LTSEEVESGITRGPHWIPFEKGDDSGDDGGAAKWRRDNPLVIDWSQGAVELLRRRAAQAASYRRPRLQNEKLWGQGGVTWNRIASYLRAREVPEGAIFSDKAALIRPTQDWMTQESLMALLNAPVIDFLVRTFLGSRLQIDIGHVRSVPVPVLTAAQGRRLTDLADRAMTAKLEHDAGGSRASLDAIEHELDEFVRPIYGVALDADLWVVR
jgi:hypothetical protein